MSLSENTNYFISSTDAVLRATPGKAKGNEMNHLIYGDWLKYLGETKSGWAKVRTRGRQNISYTFKGDSEPTIVSATEHGAVFELKQQKKIKKIHYWGKIGWLRVSDIQAERPMEVNFVDVGQGDGCHIVTPDDKVIVIDAGVSDNMNRFLSWRYGLRWRRVKGVDGIPNNDPNAKDPFPTMTCVISHPDKDHYYGFQKVFRNKKLKVAKVYHNGIVERPINDADKNPDLKYTSSSLGGYLESDKGTFLWDVVVTNKELRELLKKHAGTRKLYIPVLQDAVDNNSKVTFKGVSANDEYLKDYEADKDVRFKILGPITEKLSLGNASKNCLKRLKSNDGIVKNGHSIIFQLQIGKLKVMLGGDLNTESEDYLIRHYAETTKDISDIDHDVYELEAKGVNISVDEKKKLDDLYKQREAIISKVRGVFEADVSKACHHGSHHFSESFLRILNSVAVVISSGDKESYAHPRPDALGSFGKYSRGIRPLIFSTELARSTNEFTPIKKHFDRLEYYKKKIANAATPEERKLFERQRDNEKDRNVAVYGMITMRTDGEKVILAQKLEEPGGFDSRWDIHELICHQKHRAVRIQDKDWTLINSLPGCLIDKGEHVP